MEIIPFLYVQAKKPNQEGSDDHYQVLTEHIMYSSWVYYSGGSRLSDKGGGAVIQALG